MLRVALSPHQALVERFPSLLLNCLVLGSHILWVHEHMQYMSWYLCITYYRHMYDPDRVLKLHLPSLPGPSRAGEQGPSGSLSVTETLVESKKAASEDPPKFMLRVNSQLCQLRLPSVS